MQTEVTIIGAGIIGTSIAFELAKEGLKVVVVDRGEVGQESSWAAGGILTPIHLANYPPELVEMCLTAQSGYSDFISEIEAESGIDVEYRNTGLLILSRDESDAEVIRDLRAWKREHGQPAEDHPEGLFLPDIHQVRNHQRHLLANAWLLDRSGPSAARYRQHGQSRDSWQVTRCTSGQAQLRAQRPGRCRAHRRRNNSRPASVDRP